MAEDLQERFVDEFLIDLNGTQAAIRAGYSEKTAPQQASRLLSKVNVQELIAKRKLVRQKRTEVTQDMVVEGLAKVAFADLRGMFEKDGSLVPITAMTDDMAATLAGFEVATLNKGEGVVEHLAKIKTNDRMKGLELLGRHMAMFTDKVDNTHKVSDLAEMMERIAGNTKKLD